MILARLLVSATAYGSGADPVLAAVADGDSDDFDRHPVLNAVADGAGAAAAGARVQILSPSILVNGSRVPCSKILPGWAVERTLSAPAAWSFAVSAMPDDHPLGGGILAFGGAPPPGKAPVDIGISLLTPDGPRRVPLVTNGISATCNSVDSVQTGRTDPITGLDAMGRYDKALVTLSLPPGHGLPRGEVVRRVLRKIGVAGPVAMEMGAPAYKEVALVDQQALSWCREYLAAENRVLLIDDRGVWRCPEVLLQSARIDWAFTPHNLLMDGRKWGSTGDAPTMVTLTGTAQVTKSECGRRTEEKESLIFAPRRPTFAAFQQDGSGGLAPLTLSDDLGADLPGIALISRVLTTTEYDCETQVSQTVRTWSWRNLLTWRYTLLGATTDQTIDAHHAGVYILEPGAATDDANQAYLWPFERFVETSNVTTSASFDADGYRVGSLSVSIGHRLARHRLKVRITGTPWEETNFQHVYVLGNGEAVGDVGLTAAPNLTERFEGPRSGGLSDPTILERVEEVISVDGGFVVTEYSTTDRVSRRDGGSYLYGDGKEAADPFEVLQFAEQAVTNNIPQGETHHTVATTRYGPTGALLEQPVQRGEAGYLPAAEKRTDLSPPASIYFESPDFSGNALAASRLEQQPIKAQAFLEGGEQYREPWEDKGAVTWAETETELQTLARERLRRLVDPTVVVTTACNPYIREGQHFSITFDGFLLEGLVERVAWRETAGPQGPGAIVTETSGRVFLAG